MDYFTALPSVAFRRPLAAGPKSRLPVAPQSSLSLIMLPFLLQIDRSPLRRAASSVQRGPSQGPLTSSPNHRSATGGRRNDVAGDCSALNESAIPTPRREGVWQAVQVARVLARL